MYPPPFFSPFSLLCPHPLLLLLSHSVSSLFTCCHTAVVTVPFCFFSVYMLSYCCCYRPILFLLCLHVVILLLLPSHSVSSLFTCCHTAVVTVPFCFFSVYMSYCCCYCPILFTCCHTAVVTVPFCLHVVILLLLLSHSVYMLSYCCYCPIPSPLFTCCRYSGCCAWFSFSFFVVVGSVCL